VREWQLPAGLRFGARCTATATVANWSTWFKDPDGNTIAIDNGGAPS
jgi:hypothetical protein